MTCPKLEQIVDFADGTSVGDDISLVEKHLADCAACRETLSWYRGVVATASADATVEPPTWVTRKAVSLFAEARQAAAERGLRGLVSRLRAALVFDSLSGGGETVFARGGAPAATRQLLYSAAPFDVDMLISGAAPGRSLTVAGQVLASGEEAFEEVGSLTVELVSGGQVRHTATTSEFGEFSIEGVEPGTYDIRLAGAGREIVVDGAPVSVE